MWGVYIEDHEGRKQYVRVFEFEIDAADYCDSCDYHYIDEDGRFWNMSYERV